MSGLDCSYIEVPIRASSISSLDIRIPDQGSHQLSGTFNGISQYNNENSNENSTLFGEFYQTLYGNRLFNTVSYRVLPSRKEIVLSPVLLNNNLDIKYHPIRLMLHDAVKRNCVTILESTNKQDTLIVDLITEAGYLVSMSISLNWFVESEFETSKQQIQHLSEWYTSSRPFAFDLRGAFFMKSLDSKTNIVSLTDGSLFLTVRDAANQDLKIIPMASVSYLDKFKERFFGKGQSIIPDHLKVGEIDVSTNSVLDAVVIANLHCVVTISINKNLQIWSLDTGKLLMKQSFSQYLPGESSSLLFSEYPPKQLIKSLGTDKISIVGPATVRKLYIFKINPDYTLDGLKEIALPFSGSKWLYHSYEIADRSGQLRLCILWCLGDNYLLQHGKIADGIADEWSESLTICATQSLLQQDFEAQVSNASTIEKLNNVGLLALFNGVPYDAYTIKRALTIFSRYFKVDDSTTSLKEAVLKTVNMNGKLEESKVQWMRFKNVCEDIAKSDGSLVSLLLDQSLDEDDSFVYLMKVRGVSIIKKNSLLGSLSTGSASVSESMRNVLQVEDTSYSVALSLAKLLKQYENEFGSPGLLEIYGKLDIADDVNIPKLMESIFGEVVSKCITKQAIQQLLGNLNSIPDALNVMQFLLRLITFNPLDYEPAKNVSWSDCGRFLLASEGRINAGFAKRMAFQLMLVLVTVDICDPAIELFESSFKLYKHTKFVLSSFSLSLDDTEKLVTEKPTDPSNAIPFNYIAKRYGKGALIRNGSVNLLMANIFKEILQEEFTLYVVSSLLSLDANAATLEYFASFIDVDSPVGKVLKGFVLLKLCSPTLHQYFVDAADAITEYSDKVTEKEQYSIKPIESKASLLLVDSKPSYFYNLGLILQSNGSDNEALRFVLDALETKNKLQDASDDSDIVSKIFELALKLNNFQMAYDAILKMDRSIREHPIKQFVYKLFQQNELPAVLKYQFTEDFDIVDDLIYTLGETSAAGGDLQSALKYYRTSYALRLKEGDYRAAAESLYRFNCIASDKLKRKEYSDVKLLVDNYLIIFNLLHTMKTDDRWLIKRPVGIRTETVGSRNDISLVSNDQNKKASQLMTFDALENEFEQFSSDYGDGRQIVV
ncbi:DEBR0S2_11892g1_1 [Brettanomyces bruxellensis]|uniref:DEBR0S2_11892g1_1 n=1 Tax=Dekkera bruxellensis TaxID=5007 RepID=A0A7D9CWX1_DEKBR|nr:DEBR0S2_11892g1_1 [Brettanomyces bruxellensis]